MILGVTTLKKIDAIIVELQWGYFELVLESVTKNSMAADIFVFGIISGDVTFFFIDQVYGKPFYYLLCKIDVLYII